jgi:sugar O-acyltransferase (sialic acid O-acetyltransferase NeuD family)
VADVAACGHEYVPVGFVENWNPERCGSRLDGLPIHWVDDLAALASDHWAICSLATVERWKFIEQVASRGVPFATLVHPGACLAPSSSIGEGTFIGPGVIVAARAILARHVRVNRGAMIGHHTEVGEFSTIQPGANIAGCCRLGARTSIGIGAIVTERVSIGADSMISAGAVVTKDVPDGVQVAGRPARGIRRLIPLTTPAEAAAVLE